MAELASGGGWRVLVGDEPPSSLVDDLRRGIATAPPAEAGVLAELELFGRLATTAMLPAMDRAFARWRPQFVLREACEYSAAVVARRMGTPFAQVAVSQGAIEASALETATPALADFGEGVVAQIRSSPYLTRFPGSLDPEAFGDTRRVGPSPAAAADPLPRWWDPPDAPVVYLTLGSLTGSLPIADDAYRALLDAVSGLEVRALLTVGHHLDPARLGPVPANVRVTAWVPQADVLGEAALVVCHGGSGTTLGALAAGLPLVVVPLFADQFANARRVEAAGAGLAVDAGPGGRLGPARHDPSRISAAVHSVLGELHYAEAARAPSPGRWPPSSRRTRS